MPRKLVIDFFAGGGGASMGLAAALGRGPDIAINHDPEALAMHAANHPDTRHVEEDVFKADLRKLTRGRKVGLAWFSPDCRHFSRAKGGKPVSKGVRSLAWIVVKAAAQIKPDVIMLENVREFADWGPLVPRWTCRECRWKGTEGQAVKRGKRRLCPNCDGGESLDEGMVPDIKRKGTTFRRWLAKLRGHGYAVEYRTTDAADYGAPTHRKRLFLVARRDGKPIIWPEPTHVDPAKRDRYPLFERLPPYRTAAEIIDWELPCLSIFASREEAREWARANGMKGVPQRPLKDKTLRRIALGIERYVLNNPQPFIVRCDHGGDHFRGQSLERPLATVAGDHGFGLVSPTLIQTGYGERTGQAPRVPGLDKPLGTVVSGGQKHALVAAMLSRYNGQKGNESRCHTPAEPVRTLDTQNRVGVVAASLTKFYGGVVGQSPNAPLGTVTAIDHHGLVAANLVKFRGDSAGQSVNEPLPTITSGAGAVRPAGAAHALGIAATNLIRMNHGDKQWDGVDQPLGTVTSQGNKFGVVYAFLTKYFGTAIGSSAGEPLHTLTSKPRFGVVLVEVAPGRSESAVALSLTWPNGVQEDFVIADIALRMLRPRELARAQGFPEKYILLGSTASQVAKIGNSVPPVMAERLAAANYPQRKTRVSLVELR